jgi:hypothetical protein
MLSNRWANYINQTLAIIKITTYSTIALAGIIKLITNWPASKQNWQTPIGGTTDIKDYSTSILLVIKYQIFFFFTFFRSLGNVLILFYFIYLFFY